MFFGVFLFLLPIAAFIMFFILLFQKKTTGLKFTFLYFVLTSPLGIWSLTQYQDALSFIILPFYVTAGAFGIWLFCNFKDASSKTPKAFAWLGFIVAFIIVGNFAGGGHATKTERLKNAAIEQEKNTAAAFKAKTFAERLNATNINKDAVIRAEIAANQNDSHYMNYFLDSIAVPIDSLQMLYKNQKVSSLSIMRNRNITPELIEDIYKNDTYKPYLYGDLARNQRTPEWILREVYAKQHEMFGPGGWNRAFAENSAIPHDILIKIADTKDQYVIGNLLRNPKLSCDVLQITKTSLANTEKRNDKNMLERISVLEQTLCH